MSSTTHARSLSPNFITYPQTAAMAVMEYLYDGSTKEENSFEVTDAIFRAFENRVREKPLKDRHTIPCNVKSKVHILSFLSDADRCHFEKTAYDGYRAGKLSGLCELAHHLSLSAQVHSYVRSLDIISSNFGNRDGRLEKMRLSPFGYVMKKLESAKGVEDMRKVIRRLYLYPHSGLVRRLPEYKLCNITRTKRDYNQIKAAVAIMRRWGNCDELTAIGFEFLEPKKQTSPLYLGRILAQPGVSEAGDHVFASLGNLRSPFSIAIDLWHPTSFLLSKRDLHLKNYISCDSRGNPQTSLYNRATHYIRFYTFTTHGSYQKLNFS